jgi:hypothetical protein
MSKRQSVPYRCPKCLAEGSYYGRLVFPDDEPGNCPHHKTTPLVPSKQEGSK